MIFERLSVAQNLDDYGMVEYGESCWIYTKPTRLLLLTKGLICVGTKMSSVSSERRLVSHSVHEL